MSAKKRFMNRNHSSLKGFNYGKPETGVKDLDACNVLCGQDPDCMWSTFNATTGECWKSRAQTSEGTNLGFKQPGGYALYENKNLPGFELETKSVGNEVDCQNLCNGNSDCEIYTYNSKTKICQTKGLDQISTGLRVDNPGFPSWYWWMIGGFLIFIILLIIILVFAYSRKSKK